MIKKLALFIGAVAMIVAGVTAFLAFESYTLDINAHLEPVLNVNPHGDWDLGTVYPEMDKSTKLFIGLSNSAKDDPNFKSVAYTFGCQKKDAAPAGAESLCPHIEASFQPDGTTAQCTQDENACKWFNKSIVAPQNKHGYGINILFPDCLGAAQKVPFPVKTIDCNFDPLTQKYAGVDLAAMISVQVLGIDQNDKCITKKDGTPLPDCVKGPNVNVDNIVDCDGALLPDGTGSILSGCGALTQEVEKGAQLTGWPAPNPPNFGPEGIDIFDRDGDGAWTKNMDDIHIEEPAGSCWTGDRSGSLTPGDEPRHNAGSDCVVLDLNDDLPDGEIVDCDLETGSFCTGTLASDLAFFDTDGNGAWNNGEDIVHDANHNLIFD